MTDTIDLELVQETLDAGCIVCDETKAAMFGAAKAYLEMMRTTDSSNSMNDFYLQQIAVDENLLADALEGLLRADHLLFEHQYESNNTVIIEKLKERLDQ